MSGFGDYLERNYDAGREEEQVQEDDTRAKEINAEIEKMKIKMRSQLINEAVKEKGISVINSRGIEGIYNDYVNKEEEYLVDGAILQCNQATWDDFPVPGGEPVELEGNFHKKKKPHTTLCVNENPISSNGLIFATVGDTIKDINIIPFKCNCKIEADRESEIEKIKNDESCSEHGVCRHLMQLNSEWENVSLEGSSYLSKRDISGSLQMDNYYLQQVRYGIVENSSIAVEKEGLNMCSILFCKHGGIITPVNSGQRRINSTIVFAAPCTSGNNPLSDDQKRMNAEYIYSYLSACGWTTEAICGLLGNINNESGYNPGIWQKMNNDSKGYGIVQWSPAEDFLRGKKSTVDAVNNLAVNNPVQLMDMQLEYLLETLEPGRGIWLPYSESATIRYARLPLSHGTPERMSSEEYTASDCDPRDLALVFNACYERSGAGKKALEERANAAKDWYKHFTGIDLDS